MEVVIESVKADGRKACLRPVDPTVVDQVGGSVCAQIFVAPGTNASKGDRVQMRWFSTTGAEGEQPDEAFLLSPSRRLTPPTNR